MSTPARTRAAAGLELRETKDDAERTRAERVAAERAIEWLRALSATWTAADVPDAKADLLHAIYDQIVVTGRRIVSLRVTPSAYPTAWRLRCPPRLLWRARQVSGAR